jgi:hypothetical protein
LDTPGNVILKNDFGLLSRFILFRFFFYELETMLRAGFFTNTASITGLLSKKELIRAFFTVLVDHQCLCRTIDRAKAATCTFLFIDGEFPMILEPKPL